MRQRTKQMVAYTISPAANARLHAVAAARGVSMSRLIEELIMGLPEPDPRSANGEAAAAVLVESAPDTARAQAATPQAWNPWKRQRA